MPRLRFALVAAALLAPPAAAADPLTPAEARTAARDAYVYGVPMVDSYKAMYAFSVVSQLQSRNPWNTVLNIPRVLTAGDTAFVTPNADTPYTFAGLDLRAEPVVVTVPKMEANRYFVFQLMDLYTFNFAYIGTRSTGNGGGRFLVAGPDWKGQVPEGVAKVFRAETRLVNVVGRTQLFDAADLANVKKVQAGYDIRPLSAHLGTPPPPAPPPVEWPAPLAPGAERTDPAFFDRLAFLLQFADPPHPSEVELRARFARLGVVPGKRFAPAALPPDVLAAVKAGMADGQKLIDDRRAALAGKTDALFGARDDLKGDFVARATGAQVGIGSNTRDEALYPVHDKDADGRPLDGAKHRYAVRFAKGGLPPVRAFWSVTAYDRPNQWLVKNALDRYVINSTMLPGLVADPDGGLTLHVQADSPGKDREANWLPAPRGPFMLVLRYYWPKPELLDGTWASPAVRRVD